MSDDYLHDLPIKQQPTFVPFRIGGLQYSRGCVFVLNTHEAKSLFSCACHKGGNCLADINNHSAFVLQPAYIDNSAVLLANLLSADGSYCSFGYIRCDAMPLASADALVGGLYLIDTQMSINHSTNLQHNGVVCGKFIGMASNSVLFTTYNMCLGH